MKKCETIKKEEDFTNLIKNGKYVKNQYFVIYYLPNLTNLTKFGIAIGKKVGNAVVRNKLKRQVRFILDNNKNMFSKGHNYIIMVRKSCAETKFAILNASLTTLIKEKVK